MYCPHCGQLQTTGAIRFCSRCGFPLDGVIYLLGNGGMLPIQNSSDEPQPISPRKRGVKQGGILFLSGAVIVPLLAVLGDAAHDSTFLNVLIAFAAIICFVGGPLRMLYAGIFEEGAPNPFRQGARPYVQAPMPAPQQFASHGQTALPPAQSPRPVSSWRSRPVTSELAGPPSVTENTTRLLDKEDRTDG
ncbi:MAG TPA: hypothetical protein VFH91_05950 [Pyrinomonadaceae bacterium]|nr:hypothetical protein [Pyrinomonadaceae bacterium]